MGFHHEFEHNEPRERFAGGGGLLGAALAFDAIATTGLLYQNYEMGNQQYAAMGFPPNPFNYPDYSQNPYSAVPPPEQYSAMPPPEQYSAMQPPEQYSAMQPAEQYSATPPPDQYGANSTDSSYAAQEQSSLEMSPAPYPATCNPQPAVNYSDSSQPGGPPFTDVDLGPDPDNSADALNGAELSYLQSQSGASATFNPGNSGADCN